MRPNKPSRLTTNIVMLYIMTLGKYLLPLLVLPYLTRLLTPEYYGIVNYITAIMTYFQVFIDFGFNYSSTRSASLERENKQILGEILGTTIMAKLFLSVVGAIILVVIIPNVDILRDNVALTLLYFLSVVVTIFLPDYIYRGMEKMSVVSVRFIIARLTSTILTFCVVRSKDDILWLPILTILGNIVAVLFSYIHLFRVENIHVRFGGIRKTLSFIKESSSFFVATFSGTAYGATTVFLMGLTQMSTTEISYWSVAYQVICAIQMLYDPITSSVYPNIVQNRDFRVLKRMMKLFMPVVVFGTAFCFFFSKEIVVLIGGKEYVDAAPVFVKMLPILVCSFPAQLIGFPALAPLRKEKYATWSNVISAIFHVVGLFFLILIRQFNLLCLPVLRSFTDVVLLTCRVCFFVTIFRKHKLTGEHMDNEL